MFYKDDLKLHAVFCLSTPCHFQGDESSTTSWCWEERRILKVQLEITWGKTRMIWNDFEIDPPPGDSAAWLCTKQGFARSSWWDTFGIPTSCSYTTSEHPAVWMERCIRCHFTWVSHESWCSCYACGCQCPCHHHSCRHHHRTSSDVEHIKSHLVLFLRSISSKHVCKFMGHQHLEEADEARHSALFSSTFGPTNLQRKKCNDLP